MKILLLQDHLYLPSWGGGIKANRALLEALARRGHECAVVCPALTTRAGPKTEDEFFAMLGARGVAVESLARHRYRYHYRGVTVEALNSGGVEESRRFAAQRLEEMQPDAVLVSDDRRRFLVETAVRADGRRTALVFQTIVHLPFGPHALHPSKAHAEWISRARTRIVISRFLQEYVREHGGLSTEVLNFPVYGDGPFPDLGCPHEGFITLINPCIQKGLDIFLALARTFPNWSFAAVPTWGADEDVLAALQRHGNITILQPVDDVGEILEQTRVLLVPSLWPETFGYVAPEAMLRGIPVLASDVGGLPEAMLGVDHVLPVRPAERQGEAYVSREQDLRPWAESLAALLQDPELYRRCSQAGRRAAHAWVAKVDLARFEEVLGAASSPAATEPARP